MEQALNIQNTLRQPRTGRDTNRIKKAAELYILYPEKTAKSILLEAGYSPTTAKNSQTRVFRSQIFVKHVGAKQSELRNEFMFSATNARSMLMDAYEKAKARGDTNSMINAVDSLCRLFGLGVESNLSVVSAGNENINLKKFSTVGSLPKA